MQHSAPNLLRWPRDNHDTDAHSHRYCDRKPNDIHHAFYNAFTNCDEHATANTHRNSHSNSRSHEHPNSHSHSHICPDEYLYIFSYPCSDSDFHHHLNTHQHFYSNCQLYCHSDSYPYSNHHTYFDLYTNSSNRNFHSNVYPSFNCTPSELLLILSKPTMSAWRLQSFMLATTESFP
jgi:hypothetical protein